MTAHQTPDPWVWLARVRRAQGRKGEVFAEILTDFPQKFAERQRLWLIEDASGTGGEATSERHRVPAAVASPREVQLLNHWLHKDGIVLHFAGVDTISDAEALKELIVAIPRAERAALGEDEVYIADLIGCTLVDVSAAEAHGGPPIEVGEIENVERGAGPVPLLMVRGAAGEILIPFAKGYLRNVNLDARRVEMALPEGLAELNA